MTLKPVHNLNPDVAYTDRQGVLTMEGKLMVENVARLSDRTGGVTHRWLVLPSYAVADLPMDAPAGAMAYCTDETGGAVPVFRTASDWRRVTDRAVAS